MYDSGIVTVGEIPDGYKLNDKQRIQQACVASGEPHVDQEAIQAFLSSLEYPLYYLDFETIGPAVPLFDGIRPYQNIPFQFSLHIVKDESSQPEHFSFLADGTDDPRPALLSELQKTLGNSGSIIAYNKGFEEGILRDMASAFPEYSDWIEILNEGDTEVDLEGYYLTDDPEDKTRWAFHPGDDGVILGSGESLVVQ